MSTKHLLRRCRTCGTHFAWMLGYLLVACYPANITMADTIEAESVHHQRAADSTFTQRTSEISALTANNAKDVLYTVLDVITGQIYNEQYFALHEFTDTTVPTSTDYILQTERDSYESRQYDCPESGEADITVRSEEAGEFESSDFAFLDCRWSGFLINGGSSEFNTDFGEYRYHFNELSLVDVKGQLSSLTGFFSRTIIDDFGTNSAVGIHTFRSEQLVYTVNDSANTLTLDVTKTSLGSGVFCPRFIDCYESASFDASFTLRDSRLAGDHELVISTPQVFVNDDGTELRFDRGTLSVVADDGSTMSVEADNGNPSSTTLTTITTDSITTAIELSWSDLYLYLERVR